MLKELHFSTEKKIQLVNITSQVSEAVESSSVKEGACLVFAPHATAAIILSEDEEGLKNDVEKMVERIIPKEDWQHNVIDDNASAHLASSIIGASQTIPIAASKLVLGTWQEIFFLELDGPRSARRVVVKAFPTD